jgi:hypothetical protein
MPRPPKPTITQRIGETDPVFSMGQRAWDFASYFWGPITISGLWGCAVTVAAYLSTWWEWLGPLGVVGLAFVVSMGAWLIIAAASNLRSKSAKNRAEEIAYSAFKPNNDAVNPLLSEFHNQRILVNDVMHPFKKTIENKTFTKCELVGPANILLSHGSHITGCGFYNCDLIPTKKSVHIQNAIVFTHSQMISSQFWNCTIYVHPDVIPHFEQMKPYYVSMTGDPAIDNRLPPNIA